ncbi:MAG: hypothetical protein MUC36_14430 [Planctomycetes bacterium]|nr:hypothetical protein [Planctomycetota bacterium]
MSILVGIAVGLTLTILDLEALGGLGAAVACLHLFLVPGLGLGLLGFGIKTRRATRIRFGLALVLAAVASFVASGMLLNRKIEASKAAGDELCVALESCRQSSGRYPENLQALVPEWLSAVPWTSMGLFRSVPFDYRPEPQRDDYTLGFHSTFLIYCARARATTWKCDD